MAGYEDLHLICTAPQQQARSKEARSKERMYLTTFSDRLVKHLERELKDARTAGACCSTSSRRCVCFWRKATGSPTNNPDAQSCGVWMIDFANATPSARQLTHRAEWIFNEEEGGNQEEGYLSGLDNLIDLWEALEVH